MADPKEQIPNLIKVVSIPSTAPPEVQQWMRDVQYALGQTIDLLIDAANRVGPGNPKESIELDNGELHLVGDQASPGNNMTYGTNGSGVKGWY